MAELLASRKVRTIVQEFWNSDEMGMDITEKLKTKKTAMEAIHDCSLVGKVMAIEKTIDGQKKLFLINKEKFDASNGTT